MQVSRFKDFLGGLAARNTAFFLKLGNIESRWLKDAIKEKEVDRPIYICGLARSGSTILLELLAAHPDVASHQYKDFPLVFTPFWWNWFLNRASSGKDELVERAHKDRIQVSPDSPEAMEEMLWMAFFSRSHDAAASQIIGASDRKPEFDHFYREHIRKILYLRDGRRYIAKGNYNISRLGYLADLFPDGRFLIPVRDPASHIASLMKQHENFCDAETRDPKVLAYMRRAGHFEFGLDRRAINFGRSDALQRIENLWKQGQEIRGWAAYWASLHSFVADLFESEEPAADMMLLIDYGAFCKEPVRMLQRIYAHCQLEAGDSVIREQASRISAPDYYNAGFTDSEIEIINEETAEIAERIQRLIS